MEQGKQNADDGRNLGNVSEVEILRILRFLQKTRTPFDAHVSASQPDPNWNIVLFLIENYLVGRPVSVSTLIEASGIPYGTAQRRIHTMIDAGQIDKVYRSSSRKSYFLQPSPELYSDFTKFVTQVKSALARTVGARSQDNVDEFYLGGADFAREIMPPAPLQSKLAETDEELKFLLHDDNYFSAMRNMWADYRNSLGSRRSFILKRLPDLHSELKTLFESSGSPFDVVALNMPWLGEFAITGQLRPLDEFITKENIRPMDFHPAVWSAGQWADRQYGIPIYLTVESLAIRRDLLEGRGLEAPRTFEQVIEIGRQFHEPENEFYGVAWNGARGMPIASSFMILMGCCGAPILNLPKARRYYQWASLTPEQLRPNIDCEEARIVLDYMRRLVEISPPDILEMGWNRRVSAFLNGEVAMAYCWSMRASRFGQDVGSMVKRRTQFIPQPKSAFGMSGNPVGGFLLCIPSSISDARAKLAFEAISWMVSPEAMKQHVTNGLPVAPRFSVAADPEVNASSPIVRFVDSLAKRDLLCTWQRPPIPEYREIEFVLGNRIHSALSGELTVDEALALAQADADQVMRRAGHY
ncbi:extracellular solute-binding protein [Tropicibacter sp. Alg240-R139]|uniref:extracellular solute-binding protein n=1 Tax=Tropicibacter sp. Alg240-R139 TaxID=2305991 RepID=UPI0013DEF1D3|nr:extracellular solute-binding protein [Tropicibacter sp. Alg240-R139]